jgi:hypothetical protein
MRLMNTIMNRAVVGRAAAIFAVVSTLAGSVTHAGVIASEDFVYGGTGGNLAGLNGGTGFAGAWTGVTLFQYQPTGLTLSDLAVSGGSVSAPATPGMGGRIIGRPFAAALPTSAAFYGSYLFRIDSQTAGNFSTASLILGSNVTGDFEGTYVLDAHDYTGSASIVARTFAQGQSNPMAGTPLSVGTTYLYLFKCDPVSKTTTGWILTAAQFNTFKATNFAEAGLNAAALGTAANNVLERGSVTTTEVLSPATWLQLFNYSNADATRLTTDRIILSNASLNEAVGYVSPAPGACCVGAACTTTTSAACTGLFLGSGTVCAPVVRGGTVNACCKADVNNSGSVSVQDVFDFLAVYFAGCP